MAKEHLTERHLGPEAITYIKDRLSHGLTLASFLLQRDDLDDGTVLTCLPETTSQEDALDFKSGGKLRPDPSEIRYRQEGTRGFRMEPVPNTGEWLASVLQELLETDPRSLCLFEDEVARPDDPSLSSSGAQALAFQSEVYHVLSHNDAQNLERITATIRQATSWLTIGVISSLDTVSDLVGDARTVDLGTLRSVADRASQIVVGAYDFESFLVWSEPEASRPSRGAGGR